MFRDVHDFTLAAGVALLLLAIWALAVRPGHAVHRAFALLIFLRGAMYLLLGMDNYVYSVPFRLATFAAVAIPFAAVNFALVLAWSGRRQTAAMIRLALLVIFLAVAALYVLNIELFIPEGGRVGAADLFIDATYTTYAAMALLFALQAQRVPGRMHRGGLLLMSAGFALQPLLQLTVRLGSQLGNQPVDILSFASLLVVFTAAALLLGVVVQVMQMAWRGPETSMRGPARRYLAAAGVPVLLGILVLVLWRLEPGQLGVEKPFRTGLEMLLVSSAMGHLALFGLAAFALTRYHVFGIEQQTKRGIHVIVAAGALFGVYYLARLLAEPWAAGPIDRTAWALGAVAVFAWHGVWAAGRVADRLLPGVENSRAYRETRRIQLFWHEAESILAGGLLMDQEREELEGVRVRIGLDEVEAKGVLDQVLEQLPPVRSAYFPLFRDGEARAQP